MNSFKVVTELLNFVLMHNTRETEQIDSRVKK